MGKKYKTRKDYAGKCNICAVDLDEHNNCKSHILPYFVFRGLQNTKGEKLISLSSKYKQPHKSTRTGFYERGLLCRDCETKKLSPVESRISELIKVSEDPEIIKARNGLILRYGQCDYDDLLLFGLGVIFKSSISKKHRVARGLSKRDLNIIRKILNNKEEMHHDRYSVMMGRYTSGDYNKKTVSMPVCTTLSHLAVQSWNIQLGMGFHMYVFVGIKDQKAKSFREIVTESERLIVADLGDFDDSREFKEFILPSVWESIQKEKNMIK